MNATIRRALPADAGPLSRFAAACFRDAFGAGNTAGDMDRYVANAFSRSQQAAEITDPRGLVLLAEVPELAGSARLVGYAHLLDCDAPAEVAAAMSLELKRFYVARTWHGRGIAQTLMQATIEAAATRGARSLWLGVWEHNPRAVAFYGKYGFRRVGQHTFVLGGDAQTDWLMECTLGDARPDGPAASAPA